MARPRTTTEVPGEEPEAPAATPAADAAPAQVASDLPKADSIDPATIPYGKHVLTQEGILCSTAEPPPSPVRQINRY